MDAGSTVMPQRPRFRVLSGSMLALPDPRRPDRANPPTNFDDPFFDSTGIHSSNWVSDLSTRTMHQSKIPSLSQTIWLRWASRQFLNLPIVQTLLPVTFGFSLSSEAVVMRQFSRLKRLWRRSLACSHKRTSMGPSRSYWNGTTSALQPEEIT